jgi:hypothetical protein
MQTTATSLAAGKEEHVMTTWKRSAVRHFSILSLLGLGLLAAVPAEALDLCTAAATMEPGSAVWLADDGEPVRLRLDLPTPGVVTLKLAGAAGLALDATSCDGDEPIRLAASASQLAFAVRRPGAWLVRAIPRATPENLDSPLNDGQLSTSFVETEVWDEEIFLETASAGPLRGVWTTFSAIGLPSKEEDHEVDPDPKGASPRTFHVITLAGDAGSPARIVLLGDGAATRWTARVSFLAAPPSKEEDHEVDPDPKAIGWDAPEDRRIRFAASAGFAGPETRDALLEWLAEWIWPEVPGADGGFRLLALTP